MIFVLIIAISIIAIILYKKTNKITTVVDKPMTFSSDPIKLNALKEKGLRSHQDIPLSGELDIIYQDANGDVTTRTIILKKFAVELNNDVMIDAHCLKANDTRNFKLSRIVKATDPTSKQPINDILEWLLLKFAQTPQGKAHIFIHDNKDAVKILFHLARLDRQVSKAESKTIYKFMSLAGLEDGEAMAIAYKNSFNEYYELAASTYTKALRNIKANKPESYLNYLIESANEINLSNKNQNEDKKAALDKMKKEFSLG